MNWDRLVGAVALGAACALAVWVLIAVVIVLDDVVPWWIPGAAFIVLALAFFFIEGRSEG